MNQPKITQKTYYFNKKFEADVDTLHREFYHKTGHLQISTQTVNGTVSTSIWGKDLPLNRLKEVLKIYEEMMTLRKIKVEQIMTLQGEKI